MRIVWAAPFLYGVFSLPRPAVERGGDCGRVEGRARRGPDDGEGRCGGNSFVTRTLTRITAFTGIWMTVSVVAAAAMVVVRERLHVPRLGVGRAERLSTHPNSRFRGRSRRVNQFWRFALCDATLDHPRDACGILRAHSEVAIRESDPVTVIKNRVRVFEPSRRCPPHSVARRRHPSSFRSQSERAPCSRCCCAKHDLDLFAVEPNSW